MKLETKHKEIIWCIILSLGLIIFFATGCKPKETFIDRTVYKTDSTAVLSLENQLKIKDIQIDILKTDLERSREEIINLVNEISRHEIKYNTEAEINPQTGKYPIASEIFTETKSKLEKKISEYEKQISELSSLNEKLTENNTQLNEDIKLITQENKDLKSKSIPNNGFKSFGWGVITGILLIIIILIALRR